MAPRRIIPPAALCATATTDERSLYRSLGSGSVVALSLLFDLFENTT